MKLFNKIQVGVDDVDRLAKAIEECTENVVLRDNDGRHNDVPEKLHDIAYIWNHRKDNKFELAKKVIENTNILMPDEKETKSDPKQLALHLLTQLDNIKKEGRIDIDGKTIMGINSKDGEYYISHKFDF